LAKPHLDTGAHPQKEADFVKVTQNGSDAILQVDTDGPANAANFSNVAILHNYATANPDPVIVYFEGQNNPINVTP